MPDTILIVDDEDSVRRTFRDWLAEAHLDATILTAADAEEALRHARQTPIDLAVLDWNLGAGNDGLQLLQDLSVFHPDVVAILVTGYAHQATPLAALRMGVRDYLDKSTDLNRETFVTAVKRQLEKIAPAKRVREWHRALATFRASVEQVLPLVQSSAAITDTLPMPEAAATLCRFVAQIVGAKSAVFLLRTSRETGDDCRAFDMSGNLLPGPFAPFNRSLAASAMSLGESSVVSDLSGESLGGAELQPFERGRKSVLVVPLTVSGRVSAVIELFDKPGGFNAVDRRTAAAAAVVGSALMEQAIGEQKKQQTLFAAIEAALKATESLGPATVESTPIPEVVRASLRAGVDRPGAMIRGEAALELAEAVQTLAAHHGPEAVRHCLRLVESLTRLLDDVTDSAPSPRPPR
ncbi:MAG: response regulator [Gemmataceae bacterium]